MPLYSVTSPEGRTISMEGDAPPSESDMVEAFHAVTDQQTGGIKLDAYQKIQAAGQQGAMEQGNSDFLTSIANNPGGFLKSLPADVLELVGKGAASVLNYGAELWRADTGTPQTTTVTRDAQGNEQMQQVDAPLPFEAGKPLYQPAGTVLQPEGNDFEKLLSGFTTPEMLALFPFGASKAVQATFLAQTAPAALEAAGKLVDPNLSRDEKQAAATDLLLNGLMTYGLGKHLASTGVLKSEPSGGASVPASRPEPIQTPRAPSGAATMEPAASEISPAPETTPAPSKATPALETPKSSTQLTLPPDQAKPFTDFAQAIPDNEVYHKADEAGKEDYGIETEPHVTVLYGLTEHDPQAAAKIVATKEPLQVTLGKLSVFSNKDYDVLKVDVHGKDLHKLNAELAKLPNEQSFPDYHPHLTIAYLKKGEGKKYEGDTRFEGQKLNFNSVTFSPPKEVRAQLGKPEMPFAQPAEKPEYRDVAEDFQPDKTPMWTGRMVIPENKIESARMTANAYDEPAYIGKTRGVHNQAPGEIQVSRTRPQVLMATVHPYGKVELEPHVYRPKQSSKAGPVSEQLALLDPAGPGPLRTSAMGDPLGAPAIPATPPPPAPAGATMLFDARLPVTMDRTGPGSVSVPQVMQSLVDVQRAAGTQAGSIRTGRFGQRARGIFKPHEEIIRLNSADNIPTAVHEVGHALQQQLYGTAKSTGLKVLPADVRRELVGLGKALYGSTKPAAGYTGEGFAEFMRYWLTTEDAAKVAPKTVAFFEGAVLPKYPDVAKSLGNARGLIDIWRRQGATERAQRQLVREPGNWSKAMKALGSLFTYQSQVESGAPLKALSDAAALKLGKPLPAAKDPFKLYSFKRGSAGATVERMVMNHMLDVWGNPVGPSLKEALAPIKGRRKEFGLYLFGKAAEMRWQQGKNPGIALEDAQHIKAQFDSPEFQLAAQKYFDWQNGLLDYVVQADPTMADTVAKMRGANDFYAPLARLIDPVAAKRAAAQARSNPFMRMTGSGLPVKDIFDQTIINAARLVNRANKALVMDAVVKTAQLPGLGHLIEEIPREKVMEKVNVEKLREQLEALGVDTTPMPADEILQYATLADAPKGSEPIVAVKRLDGVHWYQVDPRLYETLDGLQTFSLKTAFPNLPGLGTALDLALAAPGRMFKLGVTGLRAPFSLITNPARDLPTALVQSSVNPAKFAAQYPGALADVIRAGLGGKEQAGVQQFYDLGAHMGQPLGIDISHTKRVSNELFHGRVLRTVMNPIDHLRQLFSITEAAPRVAELRALANELGWTPGTKLTPDQATQLAIAAKQVTVDFSAMGDVSRIVNAAVPFYNPAIQGMRSFARAFQQHPVQAAIWGTAIFTVPALLNWWRNKDKAWYQALPWREKYTYTNIDDGQSVWRIPRPFDWGNVFMVVPEAALDSWYRHDPTAAKAALGHIFDTQNPLDYPVLLKLAKEQWENNISFWDRPIVPRGEVDLPASMQVGPYTSQLAIGINKAFPNISPRRVDAALRGYFGGVYSDLVGALGLTATQADRDWERSDIPVLGVLFRRGGDFNAQNQNISDFYDAYIPAKAKVDAQVQQLKRTAMGQPGGNALVVTPADRVTAGVGEDAAKAISTLVRLANVAKDYNARTQLYKQANDMALRALTVMRNAQAPAKGK